MNTVFKLDQLGDQPPVARWFGADSFVIDVEAQPGGISVWHLRVFQSTGESTYRLCSEALRETSFPVKDVVVELREGLLSGRHKRSRP